MRNAQININQTIYIFLKSNIRLQIQFIVDQYHILFTQEYVFPVNY